MVANVNSNGEKYNLGKLNVIVTGRKKEVFHWYVEAYVRFLKTNNKCKKNLSYFVNFHTCYNTRSFFYKKTVYKKLESELPKS